MFIQSRRMPLWPWSSQTRKPITAARPGSVSNMTRKQSSPSYRNAKSRGLSNANAMNYVSKMNTWTSKMPKYNPGQHPNNAASEMDEWLYSNPKPLLPGEIKDPHQAAYNASRLANNQRRWNEQRGGRSRKNRKTRKSRR